MNTIKYISCLLLCFIFVSTTKANINKNKKEGVKPNSGLSTALQLRGEECTAPTEQLDFEINNVRARLLTGGDSWWDFNATIGRYIVPAVPVGSGLEEVSALYNAAVWLGGFDPSGNLKLAATDYRTTGQDFYTGPLMEDTGLTCKEDCDNWDRFFMVKGDEADKAIRDYEFAVSQGVNYGEDTIPDGVKFWPGVGNPFFFEQYGFDLPSTSSGLGSFWDEDLSGDYDPTKGDFPIIDIRGCEPTTRNEAKELVPDDMWFWIYNDAGGPHSLSFGTAINMEVQVQAFAYATNDEINDMTFQRYKLINRASTDINDTYFGWWVDPDLGCAQDDYSGCDIERSLAYTYNEDALDGDPEGTTECGGTPTYGATVPLVGTDYFRGPLGPKTIVDCGSGIGEVHVITIADDFYDEDIYAIGDTICTINFDPMSLGEPDISVELGMSSFMYYNNPQFGQSLQQTQDPAQAAEFYNYLTGVWRDGTPLTTGGTGYNPGSLDATRYAFSDPPNLMDGFSMAQEDLPFGDRRTLQASGPFLLKPGARNELIIGAVWVPNVAHPFPDISPLQAADDIAQNLFNACFDIIDGPDAPDIDLIELDREIILVLSNDTIDSNNAFEEYNELDILSNEDIPEEDRIYLFEGYKIYQLKNATVSPQELDDIENAILIEQVDIRNGVEDLYNWTSTKDPNPASNDDVWLATRKVDGADEGIKRTFSVTTDAFSDSDPRLINHKNYYFMVVAYAYNDYETFSQGNPILTQQRPYLEGRGNIRTYKAVPRPIVYQGLNAEYGQGVAITRLSGVGVGGNVVDMTDDMAGKILDGSFDGSIDYKPGAGPIQVQIYNPLEVRDGKFELELQGTHNQLAAFCSLEPGVTWVLREVGDNPSFTETSAESIDALNEQLIPEYGFSISIGQTNEPGTNSDATNGALAAFTEYEDDSEVQWFNAIRDNGAGLNIAPFLTPLFNFLKTNEGEVDNRFDRNQSYSSLGDGYFYPFTLASGLASDPADAPFYVTPAWRVGSQHSFVRTLGLNGAGDVIGLQSLNNVDIIFTSDKSKWSKCMVVESASEDYGNENPPVGPIGTDMFDLRQSPSIDENGSLLNDGTIGYSFFPGYAIDVETGKRLNIFFGENSSLRGADMIFNPTDVLFDDDIAATGLVPSDLIVGGQHYIYVTSQEYDRCEALHTKINSAPVNNNLIAKAEALLSVTWSSMCYLQEGTSLLPIESGIIPNGLTVKLRVENPYNLETDFNVNNVASCNVTNGEFPLYEFEISGLEAVDLTQAPYEGELADVNVVPNPYYAYSSYEISELATTVKITNLPDNSEVTIYSLDGKFIKQFRRDEMPSATVGANRGTRFKQTIPDVEWDLKNQAGIPIASGVYLIHISALGEERTIKWFGVNRKFDPSGLN